MFQMFNSLQMPLYIKVFFTGKIQIKGTCSGTYDNNKQEITSPNYPRNYHNSKTCTWKLEAPQGRRIGLKFLDFDLEQSSGCRYDWLKVYNGGSDSSPVLKDKLCGASRPSNTVSSGNQLFPLKQITKYLNWSHVLVIHIQIFTSGNLRKVS